MGRQEKDVLKLTDGFGVFVSLALSGSTTVFTIVGEFIGISSSGNSIGVYDTSTTTSNHGPDTTFSIEDGKFERGTS